MTLLPLQSNITILNTYPDKVRAHIQYQLPEGTTFSDVREFFDDRGFIQVSRKAVLRNTIEGNQSGFLFDVMLSYAQRVALLHVYIDLNALRYVHANVGTPENETSFNRDTNWLPEDGIETCNRNIWRIADNLIWEAESTITPIVESLASERGGTTIGVYRGVSISRIEVAVDFATNDPLQAVHSLRPAFQQQIRQLRLGSYRPTTNSYEEQDGNAMMLHGYRYRGERYKVYTKTNRRIRLECEFQTEAFYRNGISRSLADHGDSFEPLFEEAASHCIEVFNNLLDDLSPETVDANTALEFLMEVGRVCRDRCRSQSIIQLLIHNGRVTSDFGYRYLRPLLDHSLIVRSVRGIYVPAPQWRNAVRQIETCLGNLQGGMPS